MALEYSEINAVFEGGGVKGIGLVGAMAETENLGYRFRNVAGTSAGAIVAALIAAGYRANELRALLNGLDYHSFRDHGLIDQLPVIGPALSIGMELGLYEGKYFEAWLRELLAARGVRTFADLVMIAHADDPNLRYRLQVIAADISRGRLLVLPRDSVHYGLPSDDLDVARAVRMSATLPFFFEPVVLQNQPSGERSYIVDGGVLSNFPVWLFDDGAPVPQRPTIGYKLVEPGEGKPHPITGPVSLLTALFSTMMEAHDARYIESRDFARTVAIPTLGVHTTEFDLSRKRRDKLYRSGRRAAHEFFADWDFDEWKAKYRERDPKPVG